MINILEEIISHKKTEIASLDTSALRRAAETSPAPRDFLAAISTRPLREGTDLKRHRPGDLRPSLIAELKRASPSKGILAPGLDLFQAADVYAENGAAAISVLTDERFFLGQLETLRELRFTRSLPLPLLRKDFILAPSQIYQSRAGGADAILLIAAVLTDDFQLAELHAQALEVGLAPLVEVHNEKETERALKLKGIGLIGINNRNLATFDVSLETTERLRPMIPADIRVVSESGIFDRGDVERMARANVDAVLVGEALVTAEDIPGKVRELAGLKVKTND
jgi:indole-3-glycerol phosphate synthase